MSLLHRPITRRAFLVTATAVVAGALGWLFFGRSRRPSLPSIELGETHDLSRPDPYDVCIIGSGFAGAVLGRDLVRAGASTLIVESGRAPGETPDPRGAGLEAYESVGDPEYPLAPTRARAVGGTSHLWTGRCDRLQALDFERNAYTPAGAAWPVGYVELEPYYDQADRTLRVQGGRVSSYSPPRRKGYPTRAAWWRVAALHATLRRAGVELDESPISRGSVDDWMPTANPALSVLASTFIAAGRSTLRVHRELLPEFTASPLGRLVSTATATRLLSDGTDKVTGLEVKDLGGVARTVRARTYVVACGGVESPRLLLLSRSERNPEGIGNRYGLVGRYFTEHPNVSFRAKVPGMLELLPLEVSRCHQYYAAFKREGLGAVLLVFSRSRQWPGQLSAGATIEMRPVDSNRVTLSADRRDSMGNPGARLELRLSPDDLRTLDRARDLIRSIYGRLGATEVSEEPISWSHHHMGTCRLGDDPRSSVTDRNLRVHGTANLYVLGSTAFVTGGASHPTPLIVALAHRLADHLSKRPTPART